VNWVTDHQQREYVCIPLRIHQIIAGGSIEAPDVRLLFLLSRLYEVDFQVVILGPVGQCERDKLRPVINLQFARIASQQGDSLQSPEGRFTTASL
jgi:hypothetical protein